MQVTQHTNLCKQPGHIGTGKLCLAVPVQLIRVNVANVFLLSTNNEQFKPYASDLDMS